MLYYPDKVLKFKIELQISLSALQKHYKQTFFAGFSDLCSDMQHFYDCADNPCS